MQFSAELIGTFFIVMIASTTNVVVKSKPQVSNYVIVPAVSLIAIIVVHLNHITCHFNPGVTLAWTILGRFPAKQVPVYVGAQILACALANGLLSLLGCFGGLEFGFDDLAFITQVVVSFTLVYAFLSSPFHDLQTALMALFPGSRNGPKIRDPNRSSRIAEQTLLGSLRVANQIA